MTTKDIINAIKVAEKRTNGSFMSWDLGKWITEVDRQTSTVAFDVIHEDELDRDERRALYKFAEAIEEEILKLPGAKKVDEDYDDGIEVLVNADDLEEAFYTLCQKEHKAFWKEEADDLDGFSVFL